ncbi:MAG: aminotransferase class I/II-fold pyridoxal phosphate-dependent enzyme, partial [Actinomycetota bacterium]|nr:aminotransferase class I/II-fold pyridoxal phosphate-dependent enzyme [Actinomycetota bacterium]
LCAALRAGRDRLCEGLLAAGLDVSMPQGGYFVNADVAALGVRDAREWCLALPERAGVVAIPTSAFYGDPEAGRTLVRFAFCKRLEVIDEAVARLLRAGRVAVG